MIFSSALFQPEGDGLSLRNEVLIELKGAYKDLFVISLLIYDLKFIFQLVGPGDGFFDMRHIVG